MLTTPSQAYNEYWKQTVELIYLKLAIQKKNLQFNQKVSVKLGLNMALGETHRDH